MVSPPQTRQGETTAGEITFIGSLFSTDMHCTDNACGSQAAQGLNLADHFRTMYDMPTDHAKTSRLDLRLTEEERELYQRAAEKDSRTLSNWIRDRLNKSAKTELGEGGYASPGKTQE
jgi:hypothetical protein